MTDSHATHQEIYREDPPRTTPNLHEKLEIPHNLQKNTTPAAPRINKPHVSQDHAVCKKLSEKIQILAGKIPTNKQSDQRLDGPKLSLLRSDWQTARKYFQVQDPASDKNPEGLQD